MYRFNKIILCTVLILGAPIYAADIAVQAIRVNGAALPVPQGAVNVSAGETVTVAFYVHDWWPQLLRGYQVQIDAAGYTSGSAGELMAMSAAIDTSRADYVFAGASPTLPGPPNPAEVLTAVDQSQANVRWTSVLSDPADSVPDPQAGGYMGEMTLAVSGAASGTFTLDLVPSAAATFLRDASDPAAAIAVTAITPLQITVTGGCACDVAADCVDTNGNAVIDDVCTWGKCAEGPCGTCAVVTKVVPQDLGGAFGACVPDGFCNIHDRNQALSCFAGASSCASINIDAGGSFGTCNPDGFCNVHDANAALACFAGTSTCGCGPAPEGPGPSPVDRVDLALVAPRMASPGSQVRVVVLADSPIQALQSYQVHLATSGGRRGVLTLEDVVIEPRKSGALPMGDDRFEAVNVATHQMLAGLNTGVAVASGAYLATFVYRVSPDADGTFVVDVLHDETAGDQTFFVAPGNGRVAVEHVSAARVTVGPGQGRDAR